MSDNMGKIVGVSGNLLTVEFPDQAMQNEVAFVHAGASRLKAEVIRIRGQRAEVQVFEDTAGLRVGDAVELTGELLSVELGPGLLTQVYDGLQNPLPQLAEQAGFFLPRGLYLAPLDRARRWAFTPAAQPGATVQAGDTLGTVPEGIFSHCIMVPFRLSGRFEVVEVAGAGERGLDDVIARLRDERGALHDVTMVQRWPVKLPIKLYAERLRPTEPLTTQVRIVDTFFPVARGGTYCIPGPFGAGKTVLQQITSRYAEVDVVVIAACGERAGEVVETLREFPHLEDPRTGKSLMERTLIICNTSSMPVAAREASVYTAVTIAEYYRQMGLHVLLLADSTSRWAQALREMSGRLEEIPGEEAFPAYLESVIAAFYERGGIMRLKDGRFGSVTIGGTVSPAGGNFEEPVTQSTLKVVGAFHGLSRERSDARRFPAIAPLESWSKYAGIVPPETVEAARGLLRRGHEVNQMMKVVGEEGTSMDDFLLYLKAEYPGCGLPAAGRLSRGGRGHPGRPPEVRVRGAGPHPASQAGLQGQGDGARLLPAPDPDHARLEPGPPGRARVPAT
jgi:V/A-type H+-transporting ATPase subunit A